MHFCLYKKDNKNMCWKFKERKMFRKEFQNKKVLEGHILNLRKFGDEQ